MNNKLLVGAIFCDLEKAFVLIIVSYSLPPHKHTDQLTWAFAKEVTLHFLPSITSTQIVTVDTPYT
jgi:hypothetical protein